VSGDGAGDISTSFGSGVTMLEAARIFTWSGWSGWSGSGRALSKSANWHGATGRIRRKGTYDTCNTLDDDMGRYWRKERERNEGVSTAGSVANRGATIGEGLTDRGWSGHWVLVLSLRRRGRRGLEGVGRWERGRIRWPAKDYDGSWGDERRHRF